jgi:hypothetical protein
MKQSPLIPKILAILEHHGFQWRGGSAPDDLEIRRTHAGRGQRDAGAWSWHLWSASRPNEAMDIGSQFPASYVARLGPSGTHVNTNDFGQTHIAPTLESMRKWVVP